jgi:cell division protein ZapA
MTAKNPAKNPTKKASDMQSNQTQPTVPNAPLNADESVAVEIYDQTYRLRGVNADHVRALAATVDGKMRAVAANSKTVDSLRVAVLAALNLADELALLKEQMAAKNGGNTVAKRAGELGDLLDSVLAG